MRRSVPEYCREFDCTISKINCLVIDSEPQAKKKRKQEGRNLRFVVARSCGLICPGQIVVQ